MKVVKIVLALAIVGMFTYSCTTSTEQESSATDTTTVACDSICTDSTHCKKDSTCVDTTKN
jgi:hypothetical protein